MEERQQYRQTSFDFRRNQPHRHEPVFPSAFPSHSVVPCIYAFRQIARHSDGTYTPHHSDPAAGTGGRTTLRSSGLRAGSTTETMAGRASPATMVLWLCQPEPSSFALKGFTVKRLSTGPAGNDIVCGGDSDDTLPADLNGDRLTLDTSFSREDFLWPYPLTFLQCLHSGVIS